MNRDASAWHEDYTDDIGTKAKPVGRSGRILASTNEFPSTRFRQRASILFLDAREVAFFHIAHIVADRFRHKRVQIGIHAKKLRLEAHILP